MKLSIAIFLSALCVTALLAYSGSVQANPEPQIEATVFAGEWEGTYTGDEDGTWSCVIDETGAITGSIRSPHGHFELAGEVTDEGDFSATAGDVETGAEFVGVMDPAGTVEGTWTNDFLNMTGEFSGQRRR